MNPTPQTTAHTPGQLDVLSESARIMDEVASYDVNVLAAALTQQALACRTAQRRNDDLLAALQTAYIALEKSVHFQSNLPFWRKGGDGYSAMLDARAAIARAKGEVQP